MLLLFIRYVHCALEMCPSDVHNAKEAINGIWKISIIILCIIASHCAQMLAPTGALYVLLCFYSP